MWNDQKLRLFVMRSENRVINAAILWLSCLRFGCSSDCWTNYAFCRWKALDWEVSNSPKALGLALQCLDIVVLNFDTCAVSWRALQQLAYWGLGIRCWWAFGPSWYFIGLSVHFWLVTQSRACEWLGGALQIKRVCDSCYRIDSEMLIDIVTIWYISGFPLNISMVVMDSQI